MDASDDTSVVGSEAQKPSNGARSPQSEDRRKDGKDMLMYEAPKQEEKCPLAKRRNNEIGASSKSQPSEEQQQEENTMITFLKKMLEEKGEQMRGMRATIEALNERLGKMQETLDRMERQQPGTTQEEI